RACGVAHQRKEELTHGQPIVEGLAELSLQGVLHEGHVLHGPRAVEPPLMADPLEMSRPRARLSHERHRVAREADDEKDRRAQDEERDEAVEDPPDDESRHVAPATGPSPSGPPRDTRSPS